MNKEFNISFSMSNNTVRKNPKANTLFNSTTFTFINHKHNHLRLHGTISTSGYKNINGFSINLHILIKYTNICFNQLIQFFLSILAFHLFKFIAVDIYSHIQHFIFLRYNSIKQRRKPIKTESFKCIFI